MMTLNVPVPWQFILYTNDAVQVTYTDGSMLALSPCATILLHSSPAGSHPLHGRDCVKQRTEFVTSTFRDKTIEAVVFRNRFAERPYLATSVCDVAECIPSHRDGPSIPWPDVLAQASVDTLPDHSVCMASLDHRASVTLAPCRKLLTIRFLCSVWGEKDEDGPVGQPSAWVMQHHSVFNPPAFLVHPLHLLTQHLQQLDAELKASRPKPGPRVTFEGDEDDMVNVTDEEKLAHEVDMVDTLKGYVTSELPQTLPIACKRQNLHKWRKPSVESDVTGVGGHVKALCSNGVLYRLFWKSPFAVEVYPGDGSILRSKGLSGHFFQHFIFSEDHVEEKMHSLKCLPPDRPGQAYSVAKLLTTAAQLLDHLCASHSSGTNDQCCWRSPEESSLTRTPAPFSLETVSIPGLGRFLAQSSGLVRVTYADRTSLEMWGDVSDRVSNFLKSSEIEVPVVKLLPPSTCNLLLPCGRYHSVTIADPGVYTKYVQPALDWLKWVNTPPNERSAFYRDTVYDPESSAQVASELNKIKCFNYIVDNHLMAQVKPSHSLSLSSNPAELSSCANTTTDQLLNDDSMDMEAVQRALQATSAAIHDLDSFISSSNKSKIS